MFVTIIITIQYRGNILELVFVTSVLFFAIRFKIRPFGLLSGARKGIPERFLFWILFWKIQFLKMQSWGFVRRAQKFCEITTLHLPYVVTVKSTVEISQKFLAFSEYMNFTYD